MTFSIANLCHRPTSTSTPLARLARGRISESHEITRVAAAAYQAEFVRNLAHELRKPVEEAESLASLLEHDLDPLPAIANPTRLRALSTSTGALLRLIIPQHPMRSRDD